MVVEIPPGEHGGLQGVEILRAYHHHVQRRSAACILTGGVRISLDLIRNSTRTKLWCCVGDGYRFDARDPVQMSSEALEERNLRVRSRILVRRQSHGPYQNIGRVDSES